MLVHLRRQAWIIMLLTVLLGLVACGSQSADTDEMPSPSANPSPLIDGTSPAVAGTSSTIANSPFAGLPQNRTAEGYFVLGDLQAPIAFEFYSDFL